jgi:hypothetical protein
MALVVEKAPAALWRKSRSLGCAGGCTGRSRRCKVVTDNVTRIVDAVSLGLQRARDANHATGYIHGREGASLQQKAVRISVGVRVNPDDVSTGVNTGGERASGVWHGWGTLRTDGRKPNPALTPSR